MQDALSISDTGLRLIKAFEGFRPVDRERVSGGRVVGYGHRLADDEARVIDREAAHELLLADLAPFEDMLNERLHAPVTQAQFDALASFAFNIGPKRFLDSDVFAAVNAGRPLEAAAGFDAWRLADIGGRTFVVDALVRRRTAEKALFLRPPEDALAPKASRGDLDPKPDSRVSVDDSDLDVLDRDSAGRLVADAPYDIERLITSMPNRRRDDLVSGEMALSERPAADVLDLDASLEVAPEGTIFDGLDTVFPGDDAASTPPETPSEVSDEPIAPVRTAIAEAADEVRDRLDALMDADAPEADVPDLELPDRLVEIDPIDPPMANDLTRADAPAQADTVVDFPSRSVAKSNRITAIAAPEAAVEAAVDPDGGADVTVIEDLDVSPVPRESRPQNWVQLEEPSAKGEASWPYYLLIMLGSALFAGGGMALLRDVPTLFNQPGELVGVASLMLGALILLASLYYLLRNLLGDD